MSKDAVRVETEVSEGVMTFVLLLLIFFSLTGSIAAAEWTDGLGILGWAACGGLCLGWSLAKIRRVPGALAHLGALILDVPVTALLVVSLFPPTLTLEEKLILLYERIVTWLLRVIAGGSASDNLIFVLQLTWLMWLLAYSAGWFVYRRRQVWGAVVPSGAALLLNLFYAAQTDFYFGLYLLSVFLLLVRTSLSALERHWRASAVGYTSDVQLDVLGYGALFALLLSMAVWFLPTSAPGPTWLAVLDPLQEPWHNLEAHFARAFSALRAVPRPVSSAFTTPVLTMGGPVVLGQRPVMDIQAAQGRYWRARVYDKYSGGAWFSTLLTPLLLTANDARLDTPEGYLRVEVTQTVKIYLNDQNLLYAQAQPLRFSIPIEARISTGADVSPSPLDLTLARARHNLRVGDTYSVVSAISVADEDSLRADSTDYPAWIRAHYLALPDTVPARVRARAQEIAAPFANPYDRAVALEKFLRAHITYDENVSAPPLGVDGVDYVLFERPRGYCNYYASAMAVMARALGVPARVVSGYALGEYAEGVFRIVEADAHSWVEIYFPRYGWIEFEPTTSKPEIERPKKPQATPENPTAGESAVEQRLRREYDYYEDIDIWGTSFTSARLWRFDARQVLIVLVGIGGLGLGSMLGARRWARARQLARLPLAARVYEEMLERARWLGMHEAHYTTPLERAQVIARLVPDARNETECIAALYTRERFGARPLDDATRAILARAWDVWRAVWWRGMARRVVERAVVPARSFIERVYVLVDRWNNRHNFQSY